VRRVFPKAALVLAALLFLNVAQAQTITVFAAASLKNALDEAAALFERESGSRVRLSYAASSALARQIERGAPADVFISADREWMRYLEEEGFLEPGSSRELFGNRLVLVAPASRPLALEPEPGFAIVPALGEGRLAMADPRHVPAGRYARAALEKLGVWSAVEDRLAPGDNVRAALALVARGETPLGIVYETDAKAEPGVMVAGRFPAASHPPIVYPVAMLKGARPGTAPFIAFLSGPQARRVFERHGFAPNP